jgi:hypothetical protein
VIIGTGNRYLSMGERGRVAVIKWRDTEPRYVRLGVGVCVGDSPGGAASGGAVRHVRVTGPGGAPQWRVQL